MTAHTSKPVPSRPERWLAAPPRKTLVVGVADMIASNDATAMIVTHSLGSCVGLVVYDATCRAGGMLHLMLPDSTINRAKAAKTPCMFVDTGVPQLFNAVYGLGGVKSRLIVKMAGGARFLDEKGIWNIGQRNVQALEEILTRNGISLHSFDVGGQSARTLRLDLATGCVTVQTAGQKPHEL
jgi:chemotaxis protein CheD